MSTRQRYDPRAVKFFYEHAGWSYQTDKETSNQGRRRCARELAKAEQWAREQNITFSWSDDWDVGNHREFYGEAYADDEPLTCEQAAAFDPDGTCIASLGCIDDADNNYRRVVNAELALEAMPA